MLTRTTRHVFSLGRRALRPVGCGYATGKELAATESDPPDALCPAKCDRDDCAKATKVARTTYDPPKSVRVTVLGAADPVGRAMCLQLKLNPLVREMRMYDDRGTLALATDLSYINTVCKVTNFSGENQLAGALRRADIVVLVGGEPLSSGKSTGKIFAGNAERVRRLSEACLKISPEAVFAILVEPVNSTLPLFSEMFRLSGVLCPNRIIGSMASSVIRSKTTAARLLGFDPQTIRKIDVVGGTTPETMVPVVTGIQPCGEYLLDDVADIVAKIRTMEEKVTAIKNGKPPTLTSGYFASKFVNSLVAGYCGVLDCPVSAFVPSSVLPGVPYMSTPVEFSAAGVKRNHGMPLLSQAEIDLFEESIPILMEDIKRGEAYAKEAMEEEKDQLLCDDYQFEAGDRGIFCPQVDTCGVN